MPPFFVTIRTGLLLLYLSGETKPVGKELIAVVVVLAAGSGATEEGSALKLALTPVVAVVLILIVLSTVDPAGGAGGDVGVFGRNVDG